jgi:tRNA-dihydrouridine synthase
MLKTKRSVFFSFHFSKDFWRTQQVRNIGVISGNAVATPNKWEEIKNKGKSAIQGWIDANLKGKSCLIVLIGSNTANRPWINYEIEKAWNDGKGVVGIRIHNLKDLKGNQSSIGQNPLVKRPTTIKP